MIQEGFMKRRLTEVLELFKDAEFQKALNLITQIRYVIGKYPGIKKDFIRGLALSQDEAAGGKLVAGENYLRTKGSGAGADAERFYYLIDYRSADLQAQLESAFVQAVRAAADQKGPAAYLAGTIERYMTEVLEQIRVDLTTTDFKGFTWQESRTSFQYMTPEALVAQSQAGDPKEIYDRFGLDDYGAQPMDQYLGDFANYGTVATLENMWAIPEKQQPGTDLIIGNELVSGGDSEDSHKDIQVTVSLEVDVNIPWVAKGKGKVEVKGTIGQIQDGAEAVSTAIQDLIDALQGKKKKEDDDDDGVNDSSDPDADPDSGVSMPVPDDIGSRHPSGTRDFWTPGGKPGERDPKGYFLGFLTLCPPGDEECTGHGSSKHYPGIVPQFLHYWLQNYAVEGREGEDRDPSPVDDGLVDSGSAVIRGFLILPEDPPKPHKVAERIAQQASETVEKNVDRAAEELRQGVKNNVNPAI